MQINLKNFVDNPRAKGRRQSHNVRILKMLKSREFLKSAELRLFSYNHTARISELRKQGWCIRSERRDGCTGFVLIGRTRR